MPTPHSSARKSPTTFIYKKVVAVIAPPRGHATRFVCTKVAGSTFDYIKVSGSTFVRAKVANSAFDFTKIASSTFDDTLREATPVGPS